MPCKRLSTSLPVPLPYTQSPDNCPFMPLKRQGEPGADEYRRFLQRANLSGHARPGNSEHRNDNSEVDRNCLEVVPCVLEPRTVVCGATSRAKSAAIGAQLKARQQARKSTLRTSACAEFHYSPQVQLCSKYVPALCAESPDSSCPFFTYN